MAADLHIHVMEGCTERDYAALNRNTLGSKYFGIGASLPSFENAYKAISLTPNVWVGEVSWLKATVLDDAERFVPAVVALVSEAIGEDLPAIDDALIAKVAAAFVAGNKTGYLVAEQAEVLQFLEQHRGKRVFTISW